VARGRPVLAVDLGAGLRLPTPVMVASGCFGRELANLIDVRKLGAIVTRSLTVQPRRGSPTPRMAETRSGLLSETGLQNEGIEAFRELELPLLQQIGVPIVVSIAGTTVEDYVHLTVAADLMRGVGGIEVNMCTPSRERDGRWFTSSPEAAAEVAGAASRLTRLPVFAKLGADISTLAATAKACVRAGAHGLTLVYPLPAMGVDTTTLKPKLAAVTGGLSGPAIHPVAVRAVYEVATAMPDTPILGVGGVSSWEDAVQLLLAGASAVQIGTALFSDPAIAIDVTEGIRDFIRRRRYTSPADLRGKMVRPEEPKVEVTP
jgi:dihydroorotate dehydrogenase (NAD+) catalytic subunit